MQHLAATVAPIRPDLPRRRVRHSAAKGRTYDPSEWFVVPLNVINQAISMIMSGEIVGVVYDTTTKKLVERG